MDQHHGQAGHHGLVPPAGEELTVTKQRTRKEGILSIGIHDDDERGGQEQVPMRDKLLDTRKTPYSEPVQEYIRTRSEEKHGSTMSNIQNGESSSRGQKRRSQEVSTVSMDQPAPSTQGAPIRPSKRVLTEKEKKKMREYSQRRKQDPEKAREIAEYTRERKMKDRSYTCVLCATGGPCRQNEKCQRYHVGLEEVTDGIFKYPDYATTKKLRCGLVHSEKHPACNMLLASKEGLVAQQRLKEDLVLCRACRVWHHIKETCTHPFRLGSEMAVANSNTQMDPTYLFHMQQLHEELLEGDENIQNTNGALQRLVITVKDDYKDSDFDEAIEAREREHAGWTNDLRNDEPDNSIQ